MLRKFFSVDGKIFLVTAIQRGKDKKRKLFLGFSVFARELGKSAAIKGEQHLLEWSPLHKVPTQTDRKGNRRRKGERKYLRCAFAFAFACVAAFSL